MQQFAEQTALLDSTRDVVKRQQQALDAKTQELADVQTIVDEQLEYKEQLEGQFNHQQDELVRCQALLEQSEKANKSGTSPKKLPIDAELPYDPADLIQTETQLIRDEYDQHLNEVNKQQT